MLLASTIAAMAFNNTRLGLVHAFAMPLGAQFHIPHGLVNAIMLPAVMRFNLTGNLKKYARIAEIFGEKVDVLSQREAAERRSEEHTYEPQSQMRISYDLLLLKKKKRNH